MDNVPLHILGLSTFDQAGGAERVAMDLLREYRRAGHDARLHVRTRRTSDASVHEIDNDSPRSAWARTWLKLEHSAGHRIGRIRGAGRAAILARWMGQPLRQLQTALGREDFNFPASAKLLHDFQQSASPARMIVHAHNLHGGYFDLKQLPSISHTCPTVLTLHDMWMLTGHCAHSLDCPKWESGCGACPHLDTYPPVPRDATAYNWRRKRNLYAHCRLYVATPSQWLMDKVRRSMLWPGVVDARVIPNGVDRSIFKPGDRAAARATLGLPQQAHILLFAAAGIRNNPFKDYATLRTALERMAAQTPGQLVFVALGEAGNEPVSSDVDIRFIPFESDVRRVALHYQAADLYLHASRADTFPNSICEAMACARAVVATAVGGIPEQVSDGVTGCLVPPGRPDALADAALHILQNPALRASMEQQAAETAQIRFDLHRQAGIYLQWFHDLVMQRSNLTVAPHGDIVTS